MSVEPFAYSSATGIISVGELEIHTKTVIAEQLILTLGCRWLSVTHQRHEAR